jgi:hypothetical protein
VKLNFLVASANKVIDDVRRGSVAASAAEPFVAGKTFHNTARVMNATVPDRDQLLESAHKQIHHTVPRYSRACMSWELLLFLRISLAFLVTVGGTSDSALQVVIF